MKPEWQLVKSESCNAGLCESSQYCYAACKLFGPNGDLTPNSITEGVVLAMQLWIQGEMTSVQCGNCPTILTLIAQRAEKLGIRSE